MSRRIESQNVSISCPPEKVYVFLSNFDHFESVLPEQVTNWKSTGDSCSFEVKGMATIGFRITNRTPYSKISMLGEGKLPFGFTLDTYIVGNGPMNCQVQLVIESDMNPFIATMAEKPLQSFIEMIVSRLKMEMEK